jgi:hypothetical protein
MQFRQTVTKFHETAQTPSSSKNAGPSIELKNAYAFLISPVGTTMFFSRRWMFCAINELLKQPA